MYPDFIGIGAQKAGTTWLYQNLRAHPEIWMPPRKEIHYFNRMGEERPDPVSGIFGRRPEDKEWRGQVTGWIRTHALEKPSARDLRWGLGYLTGSKDDNWYASLFEPGKNKIAGEITPVYSVLGRDVVAHVHDLMPEAKIIFMMRNPIERAWSQAVMSFDRVKEGSANSVPSKRLLRRAGRNTSRLLTDYLRALETWSAFYPADQIFIGFLEDISLFPAELLSRLYGFLGADVSFLPRRPREKVHSRSVGRVPVNVAAHLAETYQEEIARLDERFGGYASFWSYSAERLIGEALSGDHVAYPFTESSLWREWVHLGSAPETIRSGPLSSVQRAE